MQGQIDRGDPLFNSRRKSIKVQKTNFALTSTLAYYLPKESSKMKIQRFVTTVYRENRIANPKHNSQL